MTPQEKRRRRRQWEKHIRKWKAERLDRQSWQISTLDGESGTVVDLSERPVAEDCRISHAALLDELWTRCSLRTIGTSLFD